ncbi:MAG: DUF1846 domain-containing protein [Bacilli bacterium]|nr:DUF1846 domain-containing protein [Bacilli bacterium]
MKKGFDNKKYLEIQSEKILERIKMFDNKLYLEFGGKIFDDFHAARVLPGFEPDSKIQLLRTLKDDLEIIFCISAKDIEKNKIRADHGITYDMELLRLIDSLRKLDLTVSSVVITQFSGQPSAQTFKNKLERLDIKTYIHTYTKGYPTDVDVIVSDEGYGANPYIETTKPLVVVAAPGPCSGKLATCLSQLYHEHKRNIKAGYAKFETFPVWSLPLKHPVNVAYEAATADLKDVNMIDSFHLTEYGITAVNYNRDLEVFPVLKNILYKITGEYIYKSPTDMGVNMIGSCIIDDNIVCEASKQEIIRRYYNSLCDYKKGELELDASQRIKVLMDELSIKTSDRKVVEPTLNKLIEKKTNVISIEINGDIISGKDSKIMSCSASMIINTIKKLAKIDDEIHLISPIVLEPMLKLKREIYKNDDVLSLHDVLTALSICAATNPTVEITLSKIKNLENCDAHASCILPDEDLKILKKLKINVTSEPVFNTK